MLRSRRRRHGGSSAIRGYNTVLASAPSFGRVPANALDGLYASWESRAEARNVPDLAALLSVQAGSDTRAPRVERASSPFGRPARADFTGSGSPGPGDFGGHLPFEAGFSISARQR